MQHFTPADGSAKLLMPATTVAAPATFMEASFLVFDTDSQSVSLKQQFFSSNLWFRPPPVF
jgi:hypothetical protein